MKRQYIYSIVLSIVTFLVTMVFLVSCEGTAMFEDDCVALMDSAAIDMHNMDYASAKVKLNRVLRHTSNSMHRASADLIMMRICIMLAENKEFFDYRADARKCLHVLKAEEQYMEPPRMLIWHYIQSTYFRESASYFHIMRQEEQKKEMLDILAEHPEWNDADTLNLDANLMPADMVASLRKVSVADMLASEGNYDAALDTMAAVLHSINVHHLKYHPFVAADDTLALSGKVTDALPREMEWIRDEKIIAIPEWMAIVREELSIIYGAMGDKASSNYNRNIYFDILDATRQDMQIEQRRDSLLSEGMKLNVIIILFVVLTILIIILTYTATKRVTRNNRLKREKLSRCLHICTRMANDEDVSDDIRELLPQADGKLTDLHLINNIKPFDRELISLLQVFHTWIERNKELYESQVEQKEHIEGEIYMEQRRMEENKRRHIDRATAISIVQGITPFLDRAIHQVEKGEEYVDRELLREYVLKINAYNDVLGHWVKVRQGTVTLNVENFSLSPLLDTLRKGHRTFDSKNISLHVDEADAIVKADKALTLFMMNTLLDNARKYTPEGGSVTLNVEDAPEYVEVSVRDTGSGLSAEDMDKINNSKVYDSSQIGVANDADGKIRSNKGFGFGLMNCRGIIEKYRKSGRMFDVCQFGVESTLGKGSRFFFRLPKGVMRTLSVLVLMLSTFAASAQNAVDYVDSLYEANVRGEYESAVQYADSAIRQLNDQYCDMTGRTSPLMSLVDDINNYAEQQWYADSVAMDYTLIIQIRNEVSLAALSLADRRLYYYSNEGFLRMNKLTSQDPNIEADCQKIASANAGKNLLLILGGLLFVVTLSVYLLIYYHQTVLPVFNMRQLAEFLRRMFTAEESQLPRLLHEGVSCIRPADAVRIKLSDGRDYMDGEGDCRSELPLSIMFEGEKHELGVLGIAYHSSRTSPDEQLIMEFIAKFASIHIFFASIKIDEQQNDIELLEDRRFAAELEQQRLHVQNMVMDNCLSTIKHETMYYPNRILQLLDEGDMSDINEIRDVLKYYREVFGLLSENANRQLSRSVVKLQSIPLASVARYAKKSFERQNRKLRLAVDFEVTGEMQSGVRADIVLLQYLIDTLLSVVFEQKNAGKVVLNFEKSGGFIKFALSEGVALRTDEENSAIFYADSMRYDAQRDLLSGSQYLVAKQIIRDHDERLGHPGCRIYAEGDAIVFTLPQG